MSAGADSQEVCVSDVKTTGGGETEKEELGQGGKGLGGRK